MTKEEAKNVSNLAAIVVAIVLIVPVTILEGWMLAHLWRWFAVPVFSLRPLTMVQCLGVAVLIRAFRPVRVHPEKDPWVAITASVLGPFFTLGMGAAVHAFM